MALLTFKGGIHPDDGKSLAKDKAIVEVNLRAIWCILYHSISVLRQILW